MTSHNDSHVSTILAPVGEKILSSEWIEQLRGQLGTDSQIDWLEQGIACDLYHDKQNAVFQIDAPLDIITQPTAHRRKTLLVSDMDSTLIEQECIDELADYLGIKEQIAGITERAMNGELVFEEALKARVALLKDLPEAALQIVYETQITLMPGAKTLAATMKANGAYLLLVSGGFTFFTSRIRGALSFDEDRSNELDFIEGKLSGEVIEPILGQDAKVDALNQALGQLGISRENSIAVGDGANDVPMLKQAGLGVAYRAKPFVQQQVSACVNHRDLSALLYIQGYKRTEWKE